LRVAVVGALCVLGIAAIVREFLPTAPAEGSLRRHSGRVTESGRDAYGRDATTQRRWRVEGLRRSFYHRRSMPAYADVESAVKRGNQVEVLYDAADTDGNSHVWGLRSDGREVVSYVDMQAWREGDRLLGMIILGALGALCALATIAYLLHTWLERKRGGESRHNPPTAPPSARNLDPRPD